MAECSLNGLKTLCEKEKLLVPSSFSFSQSVFVRFVLQTHENQFLFGKGLKRILSYADFNWDEVLHEREVSSKTFPYYYIKTEPFP